MERLFSVEALIFGVGLAFMFAAFYWVLLRFYIYIMRNKVSNPQNDIKNTNMEKFMNISAGKQFLYCLGVAVLILALIVGVVGGSDAKNINYITVPLIIIFIRFLFKKKS